ncbi:MAG: zinc ribbon domain-containing protein [Polyangiaceae bacterium]
MNDSPRMRVPRWALPLLSLTVAIVLGNLYGVQLVVLTFAASALLLVIWLLWSSVQALAGESELTFEEAFSLGARSAEEEQKRAVLRALKDLEYERSVGKISEDDFHEYSARYRAEAKRLMQTLDENLAEGRKQVERELERRLSKALAKSAESQATATSADPSEEQNSSPAAGAEPPESVGKIDENAARSTRECADCQAKNELDARFCKACGKPLDAVTEAEDNP